MLGVFQSRGSEQQEENENERRRKKSLRIKCRSGGELCVLRFYNFPWIWRRFFGSNFAYSQNASKLTCGMRNSRSRLATWMEVTDEAAPTTPEIILRTCVLLQLYSAPSILLIEPGMRVKMRKIQLESNFD